MGYRLGAAGVHGLSPAFLPHAGLSPSTVSLSLPEASTEPDPIQGWCSPPPSASSLRLYSRRRRARLGAVVRGEPLLPHPQSISSCPRARPLLSSLSNSISSPYAPLCSFPPFLESPCPRPHPLLSRSAQYRDRPTEGCCAPRPSSTHSHLELRRHLPSRNRAHQPTFAPRLA